MTSCWTNLDAILHEACRVAADALDADLAKVVEIERETDTGLVRAGVGWNPGVVGHARFPLSERTSEAFASETGEPVVVVDIRKEERFGFPTFLRDHDVISIVNTPILLHGRSPYGFLQVDVREPREFGQDDINFLKTYAQLLGPVIDRLIKASELDRTNERLQLIVENARGFAIVISDLDDRITGWLADAREVYGWREEEVLGQPTSLLFTKADRESGQPEREIEQARTGGAAADVRWHHRKDGGQVFIDGQTVALKHVDGSLRGFLKIGRDITDRKQNEERQAVLLAELQHRVRNVLAMVRSLIGRTARGATTVEEMVKQLSGRIEALSRTQALLTRDLGAGVDLEHLVREELVVHTSEDSAVSVSGPPVQLAPKAAEILTLAIHELATNAVKHGALGHAGAGLVVTWRREGEADGWLRLAWVESGVTLDIEAPNRLGYGTELLTGRIPYELRGRSTMERLPDGMHCTIEFPLVPGESVLDPNHPQ